MSYAQGAARGRQGPHSEADAGADPVAEGVRLGYSVIDEQIKQGEKLAERLRPGLGKGGAPGLDFAQLLQRALDVYKDMGALALAATETLARNPTVLAGIARAFQKENAFRKEGVEPSAPPRSAATAVAVVLQSTRRAAVKLELWEAAEAFTPHIHALAAVAPGIPALAGARFQADAAGPTLCLDIDDKQPAGVYAGLVVDAASNAPRGTVCVTIHD